MTRTIGVVGLGYVGLPVAVAFGGKFEVIGFDLSHSRVDELARGFDRTGEVDEARLQSAPRLHFTTRIKDLSTVDDFIVCVPTPIDEHKLPDLSPLTTACETIGRVLRPGCLVVFESTVYPGVTEEVCIPILEQLSGLAVNVDFWVGYSPERINPGDPLHRFENTHKVVSGSSDHGLEMTEALYASVLNAPIHRAQSIKVAEAAKVIENTQRDLNIALINELAKIFDVLDIDTRAVLEAAQTKWNFLPFKPGLVGGHCIGVDPYYLTHRAQQAGFQPEVILAGRSINDSMGRYVAQRVMDLLPEAEELGHPLRILVLGVTFKENCRDTRNSKVMDVIQELQRNSAEVYVIDPHVEMADRTTVAGVTWLSLDEAFSMPRETSRLNFDAIVLAVAHTEFLEIGDGLRAALAPNGVVFDVKGVLPDTLVDSRL